MDEKTIYTINIGDYTVNDVTYPNRCLSASFGGQGISSEVIPWEGTEHNPWDYKYETEEFILDILPEPIRPEPEEPTENLLLEMAADHEERICLIELGIA